MQEGADALGKRPDLIPAGYYSPAILEGFEFRTHDSDAEMVCAATQALYEAGDHEAAAVFASFASRDVVDSAVALLTVWELEQQKAVEERHEDESPFLLEKAREAIDGLLEKFE